MIDWGKTERGFTRGEFKDRYGIDCSIQESSIATETCLWLGRDTVPSSGATRMHISQEVAKELALILLRFHYTGELANAAVNPDRL